MIVVMRTIINTRGKRKKTPTKEWSVSKDLTGVYLGMLLV